MSELARIIMGIFINKEFPDIFKRIVGECFIFVQKYDTTSI
jgi:hypothetical protein